MNTLQIGKATLKLVLGDITDARVDAVVNAANSSLMGGGGVDGAIHRRGGPAILEACRRIRDEVYPDGLPTGEAVVTTAGNLPAARVIHVVGPVWRGGHKNEPGLLSNAYRHALQQAEQESLRTVAFPSISTGVYSYPISRAANIAVRTVIAFVETHPEAFSEIQFVLFSEEDLDVYRKTLEEHSEGRA